MTDYRDTYRPSAHRNPYESHSSGSGIGGIVIAVAVVVIVFLGLSLLAGPSANNAQAPVAVDQSTTTAPESGAESVPQPGAATPQTTD